MALIINSIKSDGTGDYTSPALWEASLPANAVTAGNSYQGEIYNTAEYTGNPVVTFAGTTTDSTHTITLKAASGQSFRDNANVRTNALTYNQANGVGLKTTQSYTNTVTINDENVTLDGLQLIETNVSTTQVIDFGSTTTNTVKNCILDCAGANALRTAAGPTFTLINCLVKCADKLVSNAGSSTGSARFEFCTIVRASNGGSLGGVAYGTYTLENCAIFNFAAGFTVGTSGSTTGGHNATDLASAPGSSNQVNLTYSSQFISTSGDWRAKSGGSLGNNGTPATTYATDDISATTRSATTPTIGAWELVAAAFTDLRWAPIYPTQFLVPLSLGANQQMLRYGIWESLLTTDITWLPLGQTSGAGLDQILPSGMSSV